MRVGKNIEHFKAAAVAADSKTLDPVAKYCAVGRQLGYAGYLTFDAVTYLDAAGIRKSPATQRLQREAYRCWMIGLLFSTVSGAYSLYNLRQQAAKLNKEDGEGVVASKRIEKYDGPTCPTHPDGLLIEILQGTDRRLQRRRHHDGVDLVTAADHGRLRQPRLPDHGGGRRRLRLQHPYDGSMGGQRLNTPIVGMATDPRHRRLLAGRGADGGVFSFNGRRFLRVDGGPAVERAHRGHGCDGGRAMATGWWPPTAASSPSAPRRSAAPWAGQHLNAAIVGMAANSATGGYWLVASDGSISSFNAPVSTGRPAAFTFNAPGCRHGRHGRRRRLLARRGAMAASSPTATPRFHGSNAGENLSSPVVGIAADIYTGGYWLVAANGPWSPTVRRATGCSPT